MLRGSIGDAHHDGHDSLCSLSRPHPHGVLYQISLPCHILLVLILDITVARAARPHAIVLPPVAAISITARQRFHRSDDWLTCPARFTFMTDQSPLATD